MAKPPVIHPARPEDCGGWDFWRHGDDGNPVLVVRGLSEAFARSLVEKFETGGHHQTYWSAPEKTAPS